MNSTIAYGIVLCSLPLVSLAQPVTTNGVVANFDFDGDESQDIEYQVSADKIRDEPEQWIVGFGLVPLRDSRLLRQSTQRVGLDRGDTIDSSRPIFQEVIDPTLVVYSLPLLGYEALLGGTWEYRTIKPAFENESDVLLGVKVVVDTGTHYGWIHLTRPVIDKHTPFELVAYTYHPVPGQPILAGEPPGLPDIHTEVGAEELTFSWDSRWGNLILESAESLESPQWEEVTVSAGGPVAIPVTAEDQRFYRLRTP